MALGGVLPLENSFTFRSKTHGEAGEIPHNWTQFHKPLYS